jgi:hypothetical protein
MRTKTFTPAQKPKRESVIESPMEDRRSFSGLSPPRPASALNWQEGKGK